MRGRIERREAYHGDVNGPGDGEEPEPPAGSRRPAPEALGAEDEPQEDLEGAPARLTLITGDGAGARGVRLEPGERWQDALHRLREQHAGHGRAYVLVLEML